MMGVLIYSLNDYSIEWIDGTETIIGDIPENPKLDTIPQNQTMKKSKKPKEHEPQYQIIDENGNLKGRSEEGMQGLMEREVIKIEPGTGKGMLKTIEKT